MSECQPLFSRIGLGKGLEFAQYLRVMDQL
jgi:hypothetical protein